MEHVYLQISPEVNEVRASGEFTVLDWAKHYTCNMKIGDP